MPIADLLLIFEVYLISFLLQLLGFPIAKSLLSKLPDEGYSAGRIISTLLASLIVWQTAHLGIPANNLFGLIIASGVVLTIDLLIIAKNGLKFISVSKEALKLIVLEEYLFLVGLTGISIVRGFLPNIDTLEKFMDFGFVNSYLYSQTLPAPDMWQAGKGINYYSFGHFWASELIRYFRVMPAVGYNIVLGFIAGQSLMLSFAISNYLSGAKKGVAGIVAGLAGAFGVILAGNSHVIWYILKNRGLTSYWYAEATRFIHNTIHEFPSYSFVVADLHGHLLDLPMVLLFILLMASWINHRKIWIEAAMGILLGIMMMTNTWDIAVYGLLMIIAGLFVLFQNLHHFTRLVMSAGTMLLFMAITALPWFISFQSIASGIMIVTERSPLWQLAVLWGGGLIVTMLALIINSKSEHRIAVHTLAVCLVLLILIPEVFYAKDIYPDHPRANTMFKLTYQASIMIGILTGVVMGKLFDHERKIFAPLRLLSMILMIAILTGTMLYPAQAFPNYYGNFEKYQGLNGEEWFSKIKPERYEVINFLKEYRDDRNMVEAVGDSYTNFNAIPVFSGVPTIQGWRVHEWLWRGGYDTVAAREADVRAIYEGVDFGRVRELLAKYNVGWIVIGEDERSMYEVNEKLLLELGDVFTFGATYLVRLR